MRSPVASRIAHESFARLVCFAFALAALSTPRSSFAAWPHDITASGVAVSTAPGEQVLQSILPDGAGGSVIAWQDQRSGVNDIYMQRVSAAGIPLWTANGVAICTAVGPQYEPQMVSDGAGGWILVWQDFRPGAVSDIYAQRVNASGVPQWTANGVGVCVNVSSQWSPSIASDGAGGVVATWYDFRGGATADIYAQRLNGAGTALWTLDGVPVCAATGDQQEQQCVSDGAGGAIVVWHDTRAANYDIYAQRMTAAGTAAWTANGVVICNAVNDQREPMLDADGIGGAIISWFDTRGAAADIYAQRVNALGAVQWTANGVAISVATNTQAWPRVIADPAGGAIIAWSDRRNGTNYDLYAQRVTSAGVPQWTTDGLAVCTAAGDQGRASLVYDGVGGWILTWDDYRAGEGDIYIQNLTRSGTLLWAASGVPICLMGEHQQNPLIATDGASGGLICWYDYRAGATADMYVQRVERFGQLGNPEPVIASVKDVANDQGGSVRVAFYPSYLDTDNSPSLGWYDFYRSTPVSLALAEIGKGARRLDSFGDAPVKGTRSYVLPNSTTLYAWEWIGSVSPNHFGLPYGFNAPTTGDSVAGSNPLTAFMVVARGGSGGPFWMSAPDSGYSADDLAPATPAPFSGTYTSGSVALTWGANHEADLAGYRLYRGTTVDFTPKPENMISAQPDIGYLDASTQAYIYKLSAIDVHGNESAVATVVPAGLVGVGSSGRVLPLELAPIAPHPLRVGTGAALAFRLPHATFVRLSILDASGRRCRELASEFLMAGEHRIEWDARDDRAAELAPGVYFLRLESAGETRTRRFVLIR